MSKFHETKRLLLKTLNKDSAPYVLSFYEENKELFEPWEPTRGNNFYTLAYMKALLTAEQHQASEGRLIRYWVFLKEHPEELIGTVCIQNILKDPYHSGSLGYKFSQRYLHQGYAAESIERCIELAFGEYHIHRIDAYIMPNNTASIKLINRLSFQYEGTCRAFAKINGNWHDHMHFSLLSPL